MAFCFVLITEQIKSEGAGARTLDLRIKSPLLYRLSYALDRLTMQIALRRAISRTSQPHSNKIASLGKDPSPRSPSMSRKRSLTVNTSNEPCSTEDTCGGGRFVVSGTINTREPKSPAHRYSRFAGSGLG